MPSSATSLWGNCAGGLCKTSGQNPWFYTSCGFYKLLVKNIQIFTSSFSTFLHSCLNRFWVLFISVLGVFLNTFHIPNKYNDKVYLLININYSGV